MVSSNFFMTFVYFLNRWSLTFWSTLETFISSTMSLVSSSLSASLTILYFWDLSSSSHIEIRAVWSSLKFATRAVDCYIWPITSILSLLNFVIVAMLSSQSFVIYAFDSSIYTYPRLNSSFKTRTSFTFYSYMKNHWSKFFMFSTLRSLISFITSLVYCSIVSMRWIMVSIRVGFLYFPV